MRDRLVTRIAAATYACAAAAHFALGTVIVNQVDDRWSVAFGALGVLGVATVLFGVPRPSEFGALDASDRLAAAGAGASGVFLSQYLVVANRYSDAPSGAETLFFTTVCWGALTVVGGIVAREDRPRASQLVGVLASLAGGAAILANWERPSSFSPFVKFPAEEVAMLLAGVAWVSSAMVLRSLIRRHGLRPAVWTFAACGAVAAVAYASFTGHGIGTLPETLGQWSLVLPDAISLGAMVASLGLLLRRWRLSETGGPLMLAPALVTMLVLVEGIYGARGPMPMLIVPVLGGVAISLVGSVAVTASPPAYGRRNEAGTAGRSARRVAAALRGTSLVALLAGVVGLLTPTLAASSAGELGDGSAYAVSWTMPGWETVGGWTALCAASMLAYCAACSWRADRRAAERARGEGDPAVIAALPLAAAPRTLWTLGGVVVSVAYAVVWTTPLRVWTRWIPSAVQQDYGTEYARLVLEPIPNRYQQAAVALSALGLLTIAALAGVRRPREARQEGVLGGPVDPAAPNTSDGRSDG